jgi:hypothetical protein
MKKPSAEQVRELIIQREKTASSLELLRAVCRRFAIAQSKVEDIAEIAASYAGRIEATTHEFQGLVTKGLLGGQMIIGYAGAHDHMALVLRKLGIAKNQYDFVYRDLVKIFQMAVGLATGKVAQKVLSEEFDGHPPPIGSKTEFRLAS